MTTRRITTCLMTSFALGAALLLGACGDDDGGGSASGSASPAAVTKEALVKHLTGLMAAIESQDWDGAAAYFHFGPRNPPRDTWPSVFGGMVEKREISTPGIARLAEKGTFGPLGDVFAQRGSSWAERAEVPLERCYALSHEGAEVAVYASDDGLKLIRLDDVGKLE